jgi:hypothetical protein
MTELVTVEVLSTEPAASSQFDYDRMITDPHAREWAESAAGFITFGLGQAVVKVLEAGNLLIEAKQRLPHGEYLPWVQQACGLKPQYAQKLIKAAEWSNAAHVRHLDGVTDTATLFLLSADTTPEEVREWFMERCAAGEPPSRKEVQERKRSARQPRQPQPTEAMALAMIRKGEVDRLREALALAERAEVVAADQVMAEQRLRELGKLRYIAGMDADFHRMKDGSWIRLPHAGNVDVVVVPEKIQDPVPPPPATPSWDATPLLSMAAAAERLGMIKTSLNAQLTPAFAAKRNGAPLVRKGYKIEREGRGMVRLTPVAP